MMAGPHPHDGLGTPVAPSSAGMGLVAVHKLTSRKSSKKDIRERLERACTNHGTTAEKAKMAVKGCRKVTYVLDWGKLDNASCFQAERGESLAVPNGFKVVFEASNYVWIAEISYQQPAGEPAHVPMYRVFPVDHDGHETQPGSGWMDNISAAFRKAVSLHNPVPEGKESHRPNGRLYLGIFYSAVQDEFRKHLRANPHLYDVSQRRLVDAWLEGVAMAPEKSSAGGSSSSSSSSSSPGGGSETSCDRADQGAHPAATQSASTAIAASAASAIHLDSGREGAPGQRPLKMEPHQSRIYSFMESSSSGAHPMSSSAGGFHGATSSAAPISSNASSANDGKGERSFGRHSSSLAPAFFDSSSTNSTDFVPLEWPALDEHTGMHLHHEANSRQESAGRAHAPARAPSPADLSRSRKRNLAEGGQKLLNFATMPTESGNKAELKSIEEKLHSLLKEIKESKIEDDGSETSPPEDEDLATIRMLKMLKEIKRELVSRTIKRRRTSADHNSDDESDAAGPTSEATGFRGLSASSFENDNWGEGHALPSSAHNHSHSHGHGHQVAHYHHDHNAHESVSYSHSGSHSHSHSDLHESHSPYTAQSGDHNGNGHFDPLSMLLELTDFSYDAPPIIVGCHLTHEGLFLKLKPPNTEGLSEEELRHAMTSLRIPAASSIARATLQAADVDKNGCVSMDEFLQFLRRREKELKVMFKAIDTDNDGIISLNDLKFARDNGNLHDASDEELAALLEWMDTLEDAYNDGQIHFEEFRTGMILFPPSTTIADLIKHFREQGSPSYGSAVPLPIEPVPQTKGHREPWQHSANPQGSFRSEKNGEGLLHSAMGPQPLPFRVSGA